MAMIQVLIPILFLLNQSVLAHWWLQNSETTTTSVLNLPSFSHNIKPKTQIDIKCCDCVPFFSCNNGTVITDGSGLIDVKFGGSTKKNVCPG